MMRIKYSGSYAKCLYEILEKKSTVDGLYYELVISILHHGYLWGTNESFLANH